MHLTAKIRLKIVSHYSLWDTLLQIILKLFRKLFGQPNIREPTKRKPTCDTVVSNVEDLIENITTKKTVCKMDPDIFRFNISTADKSKKKPWLLKSLDFKKVS